MPTSCRRAAEAIFSTIRNIAEVFRIVIREPRRSSTARAPTTRSNRASNFADAPNKGDRISREKAWVIAAAWVIVAVWVIVAAPDSAIAAAPVIVPPSAIAVAPAPTVAAQG